MLSKVFFYKTNFHRNLFALSNFRLSSFIYAKSSATPCLFQALWPLTKHFVEFLLVDNHMVDLSRKDKNFTELKDCCGCRYSFSSTKSSVSTNDVWGSSILCPAWSQDCLLPSAQYCAIRVLQGFSAVLWSSEVDNFSLNNSLTLSSSYASPYVCVAP